MTGYGKGISENQNFKVLCEIKGVNSKHFDAKFFMPTKHIAIEQELRKICKKNISRGRIDVFLRYEDLKDKTISEKQAEKLSDLMDEMLELSKTKNIELSMSPNDIIRMISYVSENSELDDLDYDVEFEVYKNAFSIALEMFINRKLEEGEAMKTELINLLDKSVQIMKELEKRAPEISSIYKDKLYDRVTKLLNGRDVNELSVLNEVAIIADKSDVREEIVRFLTHADKFKKLLESKKAIGKNLDFLAQEMHREINTIGSKSQDIGISSMVVEVKSIIEQIREQVQNIE